MLSVLISLLSHSAPCKQKTNDKQTNKTTRDTRKLWEASDMSIILIVVMVSLVFVYVQTHHIIDIKYMQFLMCQLYLDEAILKKKEKKKPKHSKKIEIR